MIIIYFFMILLLLFLLLTFQWLFSSSCVFLLFFFIIFFAIIILFPVYFQFFSHYQLIIYFLFIFLLFGVIVRLLAHFVHLLITSHFISDPLRGWDVRRRGMGTWDTSQTEDCWRLTLSPVSLVSSPYGHSPAQRLAGHGVREPKVDGAGKGAGEWMNVRRRCEEARR